LFAWPITCRVPSCTTSAKGLPDATNARPALQAIASCAEHSALLVGFDSGITIGRSTWRAISSTIVRRKVPGAAVAPIRTVGFTRRITSSGVGASSASSP
jgi:hypothetical protein